MAVLGSEQAVKASNSGTPAGKAEARAIHLTTLGQQEHEL
jgi:hypothetical protein